MTSRERIEKLECEMEEMKRNPPVVIVPWLPYSPPAWTQPPPVYSPPSEPWRYDPSPTCVPTWVAVNTSLRC